MPPCTEKLSGIVHFDRVYVKCIYIEGVDCFHTFYLFV